MEVHDVYIAHHLYISMQTFQGILPIPRQMSGLVQTSLVTSDGLEQRESQSTLQQCGAKGQELREQELSSLCQPV